MALKRTLSLTLVSFYGLGTILGAGIYALIGEVAKEAGNFTPVSFIIASVLALFTAFSYAELSARFPQSAGSALYVRQAFKKAWLSGLVGWLVVLTGVTSAATIALGFASYFVLLLPVSPLLSVTVLVLLLGALTLWGIRESATVIMVMTLIEIGGLLLIIFYGRHAFAALGNSHWTWPSSMQGILIGAFIAFYAYIGFEDMVNTSEETINPEKNLPRGIFIALGGAMLLYLLVAIVVIITLPTELLTRSNMPLIEIITYQGHSPLLFTLIALIAIMNGILVQIIMASRLIYGMAKQDNAPAVFAHVYEKTHTPVYATVLVVAMILLFAYALPIATLAKLTSTIILCVFMLVHASLIAIKLGNRQKPSSFSVPIGIPILAILLTLGFLGMQLWIAH
ncbi:amino acid permease [Legionella taurinensis]|uniref:Amino acid permease n=1 Tax=Legionella taurinensis TaxID=70611 RepID=A0A3A5L7A2_9GAMM|nr:amino acid permease [Legionella taurinensis]MDX1837758.1 amino acid permease [Legionella taurinensis]PUT40036.1 amino acid transporter [Legionella taurinensis]PUT43802.1 amino acid transporter [Legionella taurinensis]PUT46065.1 amino acid transporter [Legionella taurinensis]PUT47957.1 amino acid transporter [Legionella taurinensis]